MYELSKEEVRAILRALQSRLEYALRINDGPMKEEILAVMAKLLARQE